MQLMAGPSSVQEASLVLFDLIASNEAWDGKHLFEYISKRLQSIQVSPDAFPSVLSVENMKKHRSNFNNSALRKKNRLSCYRYRQRVFCPEELNLFDFFFPSIFQEELVVHALDPVVKYKKSNANLRKQVKVNVWS